MYFSETIVVCDIKVGRCSQLNEYMKLMSTKGQGHFTDLDLNLSDSIFLNFFSSIIGRLKPNFIWSLLWMVGGGDESLFNGPGHMTKMAAIPIYRKNF